jgi:hypothetical protein
MYFLNMKRGMETGPGLFCKILDPFYAFNTLDIGYFHNQVVKILCMVNVDIYCTCKYAVVNRKVYISHIDFQLG